MSKPSRPVECPGAFLSHLLEKYKLNPFKLSKDIHLSQSAVRLIALGETRVSVPVALRLAKYFNTNPEFWLTMQMKWDLAEASKDKALTNVVKSISAFSKGSGGKAAAKKSAAKKAGAKKPKAKKPAAKKAAVKKTAAKKPAAKKAVAKKAAGKKTAAKRPAAKKAVAKKATVKRTAAKKPAAKKTVKRGRPAKK
jgi:addiction module HigA family antidote